MLRSKSSWGYSDAFMALAEEDLTLTSQDIAANLVEVLEGQDGTLIAVMRLQRRPDHAWLQDLFVHPGSMGQGLGRRLFDRAVQHAREWGYREMRFESDPHAEPFYLGLGAVRIGSAPSTLVPGRELPLMRYLL
jgi:GNAT superfamily N-acetyltransferase